MYNFSNEAKNRILNGKITRAYLKVLAKDNLPEFIINESNYLKDLTFEDLRYVPDEGFIGGTVAKRVTGNFNNVNNSFSIQDREFELYLGVDLEDGTTEYVKYGTFIVQKPEDDQVTDNTKFEALDYMVKLNLPWENRLTYPCTLKQLFDDLVEQSGIKTKVKSFSNEKFIVENNQFEEGTTRREVLKAIAQVAFNWARIDEDDELVMDFEQKDNINETLDVDKYYNFSSQEQYGPINVIILKNSQVEGENVTIKDEESINAGKGKNKFNKDGTKYTEGYYLDKNGNQVEDKNWKYTDYIKVDSYYITLSGIADILPSICAYDENKQFIIGKNYNNQHSVTLESATKIKYIRFSINNDWFTFKENYHTLNFPLFLGKLPYINTIQLEENKEETDFEPFIANGETELVISDNPFAYSQSKRAELIEAGKKLYGLKYIPMSMDMIGYMFLDCKDKIRATNFSGKEFDTYLLNHTIEYSGTISDSMESPASTKTETKYQFTSSLMQTLKHTELLVDKANQKIQAIVEEQTDFSNKLSNINISIDGINEEVHSLYDFYKEKEDVNELLLEDCLPTNIVELKIFPSKISDILYPSETLYPNEKLYTKRSGDGVTVVFAGRTRDAEGEMIYPSNSLYPQTSLFAIGDSSTKEFNFYFGEPLRIYNNIYDEFNISFNEEKGICEAKVIRRIKYENEKYIVLDTPEEQYISDITMELFKGNNYVYLKEYKNWRIYAKYIFNNELNKEFAPRVESISQVRKTADEINLEVSKKVNQDEVISSINLSPEEIKILARNLQLEGFTSINGNFTIDEEGNMICNNATINGTTIANGENFSVDETGNMICKSATMENVICENFTIKNSTIQEGYIELKSTAGNSSFSVIDTSNDRINSELSAMTLNFNSNQVRNACMLGIIQNTGAGFISVEGDIDCNVLHQNSLESIKKNITKFYGGLELVKNSDIYEYNFKTENDKDKKHIGFVIGNNYRTPFEVLGKNGKDIEPYSAISVLWNAVQELIKKIEGGK